MNDAARDGYTLAMGQIRVEGGVPSANLSRAADRIREAAEKGARIVVLPECLDLGWTHPAAREHAKPIPGAYSDVLCQAAATVGIWVAAGLTERLGDCIYNAAVLIASDGALVLKHHKINELTMAHDLYAIGQELRVVQTPLGAIGLAICADNFPDSLDIGHALARMGAQLILSPSAWAVRPEHDNTREPYGDMWRSSYTTLAKAHDLTVVGVSNVGPMLQGPWAGRRCIGCSLAVGPGGEILAAGPYGADAEALVLVPVAPVPRTARGTAIADMLRAKGMQGG
ncbi:MAG TPA: carbon-nitrogen hydrolase family protein [Candidatus Hydrogenedentes bacterium]|nr:carbon-nitrogen hydrolase family protein [Candidatus Hydrogenedentota bacterium]